MTEIETEVKIDREPAQTQQKTTNAFSSRTFSSQQEDLKKFDSYKPTDLSKMFNKLEEESKVKQEETDLDNFTKLEDDYFPVSVSKTVEVEEKTASLKVNLKGKLTIFLASVSLVLLSFLSIFNAVKISNLKASVKELDKEIYYNEQVINTQIDEYNNLTADSLLEGKSRSLNFEEMSSEKKHSVKIKKVKSKSANETENRTNWFDKVCSWVSGLFGV